MIQRTTHSRELGYTLVELLIVIAIMGILSIIALNSYRSRLDYQVLQSAAMATAEWLENARKQAMQNNASCTISVSTANRQLAAATGNACGDLTTLKMSQFDQGSSVVRFCYRNVDPLLTSVLLNCSATTVNSNANLVFSPRGTNRLDAVFEFYNPGQAAKTCAIAIEPLGIIRHGRITSSYCNSLTG